MPVVAKVELDLSSKVNDGKHVLWLDPKGKQRTMCRQVGDDDA